jgi:general L-amino acid transport system permease protein
MSKLAYVREKEIPQSAPPITEVGIIKWLRENLFSSWLNSILTILSLYFIFILLKDFIPWAYGAHWTTGSIRECYDVNPDVACFSVLTARWKQLLFGFYPPEEYWRPTLTFFLLILSVIPILFTRFVRFFWFSLLYPGLAIWLLWGGSIWSVAIIYIGLGIGFFSFLIMSSRLIRSASISLLAACLITILFFMFVASFLAEMLSSLIPIYLPYVESLKFGGFTLSLIVGVTGIVASFPQT